MVLRQCLLSWPAEHTASQGHIYRTHGPTALCTASDAGQVRIAKALKKASSTREFNRPLVVGGFPASRMLRHAYISVLVSHEAYRCPLRAIAQDPGQELSPSRLGRSRRCLSESTAKVCRVLLTNSWRKSGCSSLPHQHCRAPLL